MLRLLTSALITWTVNTTMAAVAAYILELRRLLPECEDVKKNVQSEMLFTSEVSHGFARLLNRLQQNVPFS